MALLISGATILDGVADRPIAGRSIWIENGRIKAIGRAADFPALPSASVIDAGGKYVIPGLLNANVHLLGDVRLENLTRYMGRYEELIVEAAQVALKNGLTTVFDTWGPRRPLTAVRDQIEAGRAIGSRIFCAGNIVGMEGPFSADFMPKALEVASPALAQKINAMWVENVGRHLMWQTPSNVAMEIRAYISRRIDFVKYASNEHFGTSAGAFLAFSPDVQRAIVEEVHRAGLTAQAHTTSVEGLRLAVEAGCDLIQHANLTGPVPIPETTLDLMVSRRIGAVVFPSTRRGFEWIMQNVSESMRTMMAASQTNTERLIRSGAPLLLANDGSVLAPEARSDTKFARITSGQPAEDNIYSLSDGHFVWLRAMQEKGCAPMEMLKAATRNIAKAYGKEKEIGTLEAGKIADLLVLGKNPLEDAGNYRAIEMVVKAGQVIDRNALPTEPLLTKPMERGEEEGTYVPFLAGDRSFPMCPLCMHR